MSRNATKNVINVLLTCPHLPSLSLLQSYHQYVSKQSHQTMSLNSIITKNCHVTQCSLYYHPTRCLSVNSVQVCDVNQLVTAQCDLF
jgi:hypothetical protein